MAIAPPMYERLRLALGACDRSAVSHASHALKGTAALVGAVALAARLQEIELAAGGGGTLPGPQSAEPLAPLFAQVLRDVAASIAGYDGADLAPPAP
ncbi:Hpt domain-containing protein [Rugamonas sp.]|uniref:Hpt domain-containing protein n=1 Tax=Rugamonas sp. TaxID=1926287 RepID=UPI0025D7CE5F|nr:Hpt domain-containing protein [Rugamonas sp.]